MRGCTDRGELVGGGALLEQEVDDVGVALLSGLVQRSVAVLQTHNSVTNKERDVRDAASASAVLPWSCR